MSDSEEIDELEQNENVQNISVFRKREKIHTRDDQLIEMDSLKKLNYMLTCPICLDIFQEPVYVKGCSHRFCKECIEKAIRSSKTKQCPTCRKIIGTKRLLRVDFNVQEIINLVYGDIGKFLEQKQTNDEILLSKAYSQLINNVDGNMRKKRKHGSNVGSDKMQENYQQSSPKYSSINKEESIGKTASNKASNNGSNSQSYSKNDSGDNNRFLQIKQKKSTPTTQINQFPLSQFSSQKNSNNDKYSSYQSEQQSSSARKRKYESLNNQNSNGSQQDSKKGEESLLLHNMTSKKKFYAEELKEKNQDEDLKPQNIQDIEYGFGSSVFSNGNSSTNATSSNNSLQKVERAFIDIQLKVIPYDKIIKSFDFNISKWDWTLTLDDLTKLICLKLSLNYTKFKPFIQFFAKQTSEDSIFHHLKDKTQIVKHVEDSYWSTEIKNRCYRLNDQIDYSLNAKNETDKFTFSQNRILYYMIEVKDLTIQP